MMELWITPDRLFDGRDLHSGKAVLIRDGRVVELSDARKDAVRVPGLLTPGFVDLQVNGGGGVQLNSTPTPEGMQIIADAHRTFGTVAVLPTVITDLPEVLDSAADATIAAKGQPGIIGLHIEGPHIAMARRGTHSPDLVRPMDARTINTVGRLRDAGVSVMITLAPEAATADQIAQLVRMCAVVSLGHTDATAEVMRAAFKAGASCATHLFNAMSPMVGRAPGAVGAVINSTHYSGIICDGHHVADEMVGLAIRARPVPDRMFLVSDAMATVGGPEHFNLYGQHIALKEGRLINAEGSLAGAHVTQAEGVKRLVDRTGTSLTQALRMATSVPADCIGQPDIGRLVGRPVEDVILLDDDLYLTGDLAAVLGDLKHVTAAG
ncbi:N-acetylglucosamine-6-phosphate deacetylase [Aliiroseovarius zhejiangensis]|uniref:N-acetylglucosamine-6-phosphate deacetylase n=1 Tax=Aliiroseovarius zhejiangensis TaxID=1632025 RepID=A0ABQ3ITP8_9RHOB|nr:N-acetylglucosamine-6-phosphate deacetylase [Aliiroseovarius zhejiangensis]GHE94258.1 N-acetylglucosamine-6-phosphate deacetylase [Aliiroseovarius zhejiangensis]